MSEFYEENRNNSRDYSDRYKNCLVFQDKESGDRLLATRDIGEIPRRTDDLYHRINSHESTRLDLIAYNYYKNPLLWWVIAQANNIVDPFQALEPGRLLRIPRIESLYGNDGILL